MLPSSQVSVQVLVRICEQEDREEVGVQPPLLWSPAAGHFSHSAHGPQVPSDQYEIPHSDLPSPSRHWSSAVWVLLPTQSPDGQTLSLLQDVQSPHCPPEPAIEIVKGCY